MQINFRKSPAIQFCFSKFRHFACFLSLGLSFQAHAQSTAFTYQGRLNDNSIPANGTFNNNSDRNAKQDFATVAPSAILDKVSRLPVSEWSYKTDAATRHIGPMAQDFYSAFNIGTDDKHIAPIDEGGVALAAIKGLNQKLEYENARLKAQNDSLQQQLDDLKKLVQSIVHKN